MEWAGMKDKGIYLPPLKHFVRFFPVKVEIWNTCNGHSTVDAKEK